MDGQAGHVEHELPRRTWGGRVIATLVLLACATIFVWSGVGKLTSPADAILFSRAIAASLSEQAAANIVKSVSVMELVIAAWLVIGAFTPRARPRWALAVFAAAMIVMAGLQALALARGFQGSCGCFGSGGAGTSTAVLRTLALALVAGLGIAYVPSARRPGRWPGHILPCHGHRLL